MATDFGNRNLDNASSYTHVDKPIAGDLHDPSAEDRHKVTWVDMIDFGVTPLGFQGINIESWEHLIDTVGGILLNLNTRLTTLESTPQPDPPTGTAEMSFFDVAQYCDCYVEDNNSFILINNNYVYISVYTTYRFKLVCKETYKFDDINNANVLSYLTFNPSNNNDYYYTFNNMVINEDNTEMSFEFILKHHPSISIFVSPNTSNIIPRDESLVESFTLNLSNINLASVYLNNTQISDTSLTLYKDTSYDLKFILNEGYHFEPDFSVQEYSDYYSCFNYSPNNLTEDNQTLPSYISSISTPYSAQGGNNTIILSLLIKSSVSLPNDEISIGIKQNCIIEIPIPVEIETFDVSVPQGVNYTYSIVGGDGEFGPIQDDPINVNSGDSISVGFDWNGGICNRLEVKDDENNNYSNIILHKTPVIGNDSTNYVGVTINNITQNLHIIAAMMQSPIIN